MWLETFTGDLANRGSTPSFQFALHLLEMLCWRVLADLSECSIKKNREPSVRNFRSACANSVSTPPRPGVSTAVLTPLFSQVLKHMFSMEEVLVF